MQHRERAVKKANALLLEYREANRKTMICVAKNFIQLIENGQGVDEAKSSLNSQMNSFLTRKFIAELENEDEKSSV